MIEAICAREARKLVQRDSEKYKKLVQGLYVWSLVDPTTAKLIRTTYFIFRHIDDALDEKDYLPPGTDPEEYVLNIREQIETSKIQDTSDVMKLYAYSMEKLFKRWRYGDNHKQEFLGSINSMLFEYRNAQERRILTGSELENYHKELFFPTTNLYLMIIQSPLRINEIPEYARVQSRLDCLRDLDSDWVKGIINIPSEVLNEAQLDQYAYIEVVKANNIVSQWIDSELNLTNQELLIFRQKLDRTPMSKSRFLVRSQLISLENKLPKIRKQYNLI